MYVCVSEGEGVRELHDEGKGVRELHDEGEGVRELHEHAWYVAYTSSMIKH